MPCAVAAACLSWPLINCALLLMTAGQFFITTAKADWLDGKHVVFGRLLNAESLLVARKIEAIPTHGPSNRPSVDIVIAQCGEM